MSVNTGSTNQPVHLRAPVGGEERYGVGDTYLVRNVSPSNLLGGAFERLCDEVKWCTMFHRCESSGLIQSSKQVIDDNLAYVGGEVPRLVAVEGTAYEDGSMPIYRHPADASPPLLPFSPTVNLIRENVERLLPAGHPPLNHVLVQRYRTGKDYISEHSDKTVDILRGSFIVNVSIGAQRTMTLRTKKPPRGAPSAPDPVTQHIALPHNSALFFGLETNRVWLHGVRPNRRPKSRLSGPELAFGRERISLTFRSIGTFLSPKASDKTVKSGGVGLVAGTDAKKEDDKWLIWGQGARGKTRASANPVSSNSHERVALIRAFGWENRSSKFDWDAEYGRGFDIVHFT